MSNSPLIYKFFRAKWKRQIKYFVIFIVKIQKLLQQKISSNNYWRCFNRAISIRIIKLRYYCKWHAYLVDFILCKLFFFVKCKLTCHIYFLFLLCKQFFFTKCKLPCNIYFLIKLEHLYITVFQPTAVPKLPVLSIIPPVTEHWWITYM